MYDLLFKVCFDKSLDTQRAPEPWASHNDYDQDIDFGPLKIIIWEWFLGPPQSRLKVHFWNQEFKR